MLKFMNPGRYYFSKSHILDIQKVIKQIGFDTFGIPDEVSILVRFQYFPLRAAKGFVRLKKGKILHISIHPFLPFYDLLSVLVHELVHIGQLAEGRLQIKPQGFAWDDHIYGPDTPYNDRPWEKEAKLATETILAVWGLNNV